VNCSVEVRWRPGGGGVRREEEDGCGREGGTSVTGKTGTSFAGAARGGGWWQEENGGEAVRLGLGLQVIRASRVASKASPNWVGLSVWDEFVSCLRDVALQSCSPNKISKILNLSEIRLNSSKLGIYYIDFERNSTKFKLNLI
jgi:hypothetical protein